MPKQTFYNLPEEKRNHLMQAVKKEFSRVPLNEASIANIVKNADIPRGSFYQYFEDKEDAFYYLLEELTAVNSNQFILILKQTNGDLFESFIKIFKNMLLEFQDKENRDFFKNIFLNMNYKMEEKLSKGFAKTNYDKQVYGFKSYVDFSKLNIVHEEEFIHVMQIVMAVTFQNLMNHFAKRYTFDEAIKNYIFEMKLLKKGLYKEPK